MNRENILKILSNMVKDQILDQGDNPAQWEVIKDFRFYLGTAWANLYRGDTFDLSDDMDILVVYPEREQTCMSFVIRIDSITMIQRNMPRYEKDEYQSRPRNRW